MKIFTFRTRQTAGARRGRRRAPDRLGLGGGSPRKEKISVFRVGIVVGTLAVVLAVYMPLGPGNFFVPSEGQIAKADILAPFDFPVLKDEETLRREREAEAAKVPPVVQVREEVTTRMEQEIREFFLDVERIIDTEGEVEDQRRMIADLDVPLSETAQNILLDLASETRLRQEVIAFYQEVLEKGVLNDKGLFLDEGYDRIAVARDDEEYVLGIDNFLDLEELSILATERGRAVFGDQRSQLNTFFEVTTHFAAPNFFYDVHETEVRRQARRDAVSPHTEFYLKGQKIIGAHERVTKNHVRVLRSLEKKWTEERMKQRPWQRVLPHAGRLLAAMTVIVLFALYIHRHRPRVYARDRHMLLLAVIGVIGIGLTALVGGFGLSLYLIPVPLVAMLATLLFDDRVGIALTGAFLLLVSLVEGLPLPLVFTLGVGGAAAVYGVAGLRERKSFWNSLLYLAAAYVISIGAADFLHLVPGLETLQKIGFGLLGAFTSVGLAMISLPVFEAVFRVTTNVTLLELSDLNRPLLKNLALMAPGTYHHSIMVGNLSEAAAERVGANSLLARVGAYYHDIGKTTKPEYFVENQGGGENKHDRLSPKISALILISHVREGVELARKEGLPREIVDVIREHHGDTLMAFFYEKAKAADPESEVPEGEFRYPGPKPRAKENGIVMLADVAEAATRALVEPTPGRIRERILEVTDAKFRENQLDECDLTFRELRAIQESFVPILTSAMHSRIRYPDEVRREEARFAVGDLLRKSPERKV
ncbi:MAG: HDIG domain-containing protein [Candidatus Eisenbacteria bacterium]|nr:HDIG domain-containing protein [Candidatus Eisenbacteria bacterium]